MLKRIICMNVYVYMRESIRLIWFLRVCGMFSWILKIYEKERDAPLRGLRGSAEWSDR